MANKKLTLSIVIPAYNEQDYLATCLDSIAGQTVMPDEVIVVDNNSTDATREIATEYPFVTLLSEVRQHQTFAQIKGFNHAKSDIIARIDADTLIHPQWVKNIKNYFEVHPKSVAITGSGSFYDVPLKSFAEIFFHFYHFKVASRIAGHGMLWGANCALRNGSVKRINKQLVRRSDIWEDYDLSFALAKLGTIEYRKDIKADCSFRSAHKKIPQLLEYQVRGVRTFRLHASMWRFTLFLVAWSTMVIFIPIAMLDHMILRLTQAFRSESFRPTYSVTPEFPELP